MELLFKQPEDSGGVVPSALNGFGVKRCLLKYICADGDRLYITKKRHYHSGFEIHCIEKGYQLYELEGERIKVGAGQFLMISPQVEHVALGEAENTVKYAFSFSLCDKGQIRADACRAYVFGDTPTSVRDCIECIQRERKSKVYGFSAVVEYRVWECILYFFRVCGFCPKAEQQKNTEAENSRLSVAKQYIDDNICRAVSVSEVASHCYVSEKQLSRIFERYEGIGAAAYIRVRRCQKIEKMLSETELSLREIGEATGFANEYYFNAFFKKYSGMPPGAYRRSLLK